MTTQETGEIRGAWDSIATGLRLGGQLEPDRRAPGRRLQQRPEGGGEVARSPDSRARRRQRPGLAHQPDPHWHRYEVKAPLRGLRTEGS
jgi:hypothetical protein